MKRIPLLLGMFTLLAIDAYRRLVNARERAQGASSESLGCDAPECP